MPKLRTAPVATTAVMAEVKLSTKARQMLIERCREHATLAEQVRVIKGTKQKPGRMKRIETEVDDIFTKEKQGKALLDGTKVDGFGIKQAYGRRKVFDQQGFMKKHGVDMADFDEFTTYEDNEPYIRITAPGQKEDK